MTADDADAATALLAEVAAEGLWLGVEVGFDEASRRDRLLASLTDPMVYALVVVQDDGALLGTGSVHVARYGVADLAIVLAEPARGRGLGAALLDALVAGARERGAHKVDLQVWPHNPAAIGLYLSRGFLVEGRVRAHYRRASGQLWDSVLMGLLLDPAAVAGERASGLPDAAGLPASIPISP